MDTSEMAPRSGTQRLFLLTKAVLGREHPQEGCSTFSLLACPSCWFEFYHIVVTCRAMCTCLPWGISDVI